MKGYLTVFLAMSLSILTGFILLLTGSAVRNAEKVRLECAADTAMNAVLSEFHIGLFERYGLLYVDASYLGRQPSIDNMEERLRFYLEANTSQVLEGANTPWGSLEIEKVQIISYGAAADEAGESMRNQAVCYVQDTGVSGPERQVFSWLDELLALERADPLREWESIMGQLSAMELPQILNEDEVWEDVPLSNPADWVYALAGSDALYLGEVNASSAAGVRLNLNEYISHRADAGNAQGISGGRDPGISGRLFDIPGEESLFLSYLFDKMGSRENPREGTLLKCQLEYVAQGQSSDLENMRAVAGKLFRWRFADNSSLALADGDLRMQAVTAAGELLAVQLKKEFMDPVTQSILYACAFLETISDIRTIYSGGRIPVRKSGIGMGIEDVLRGSLRQSGSSDGFTYGQYLAGMILLENKRDVNLRAMDIMEMDLRFEEGNRNFSMDWCVEWMETEISARGSGKGRYELRRAYGYFQPHRSALN